jgi:hypothetical protein
LANFYATRGLRGNVDLYRQPLGLGMNIMTNYSNQSYNAFQANYLRRMSRGLQGQFNYTYAKVMSDSAGTGQSMFEPFLDINNGKLERSRTPFDTTHSMKGNFVYELPFGQGKRWGSGRAVNRVIGGWKLAGILTYQSGAPISIQSLRATLNRAGRSTGQNGTTATASVDKTKLDDLLAFRMTGNGPYMAAASAIGTDGRGVAPDGRPAFDGQVFSNPIAGTLGTLQRRMFDGPWWFNLDFGVIKDTKITERYAVEFRMESTNFFNNPAFYIGDQNINATTFGRITSSTAIVDPRRIQFGVYVKF